MFRRWLMSTTSLVAAVLSSSLGASAGDDNWSASGSGPAVSTVNGKAGAFAAAFEDDTAYGVFGALAVPLGGPFGAQIDGIAGTADNGDFYGVAGHFFWRDPSQGLLGLYVSYLGWSGGTTEPYLDTEGVVDIAGADVGKVGVEGEAYLGRMSLEGKAAYQFGSETGFAGRGTVAYYPADDLRFDVSLSYLEGAGASGSAGFEWMPMAGSGLSLFGDAAIGEDSDWSAYAGVQFYFGGMDKSLIQRHREDDPDIELPKDLFQIEGTPYCVGKGSVLHDDGACSSPG